MYYQYTNNNKDYAGWGIPRHIDRNKCNPKKIDKPLYNGAPILSGQTVLYTMNGSSSLGVGDSIWIMQYLRDIYKIKSNSKASMTVCSSKWVLDFYRKFLPSTFNFVEEYLPLDDFHKYDHVLPAILYWRGADGADRGWLSGKSLLHNLYDWTGMQFNGLGDWSDYTPDEILKPLPNLPSKYCLFQWHSSGQCKNPTPEINIKLIKHITIKYNLPVIVIGRLTCLDMLQSIPNVTNLSGKLETNAAALFSLAFNSDLIVTPDSASLHLGEAYKIPTVGLMSTMPPSYIADSYRIPAFMFGGGFCSNQPCGVVHELPRSKCPAGTGNYCRVWDNIDLDKFDLCVAVTRTNRANWRSCKALDINNAIKAPIIIS